MVRAGTTGTAFFLSLKALTNESWATDPSTESDTGPASTSDSADASNPKWATEWHDGNFHFHCDHDLLQRDKIVKELAQVRSDLRDDLAVNLIDEPIHFIVFSEDCDYRAYMEHYFPEIPQRRALFIKRRGPGMVFTHASRELETDLRHESTHAMLNASLAYVPLWLDEGLAEYYEQPSNRRLTGSPHLTLVRIATLLGQVPEIETLESIGDLRAMRGTEYRDAWSWVHFLLNESTQSREILQRFLADIQSGLPPGPFSRRLAAGLPDYRERYLKHYRRLF